jgi:hypothetical protein
MSSDPKSVDEVSSEISPVDTSSCSISDCASTRLVTPARPNPIKRVPISKALPIMPRRKINALESLHSARYCSDLLAGHQTNACVKGLIQVRHRGYRTFWLSTSCSPPSSPCATIAFACSETLSTRMTRSPPMSRTTVVGAAVTTSSPV